MPGGLPNKGEGARDAATARAKRLMDNGAHTVREIVEILMDEYRIAENTAYQYRKDAERELGIETVEDQLTIGMLATRGALRCAQEGETLAREMRAEAEDIKERDRASEALARAGRTYIAVAKAAKDLDVASMMSDEDEADMLVGGMIGSLHRLSPRRRAQIAQALEDADDLRH